MSEHDKEAGTTGHQWDDDEGYPLKEYSNPLPRWWLYTFYATIVFSVGYWFLYPAWPLADGFTPGTLGWSQYRQLDEELAEAKAARKPFDDQLAQLSLDQIRQDPRLAAYAIAAGKAIFGDNCAPCHGSGGVGAKVGGFPALVDDDWLYGGTLETIHATVDNGRQGAMPAHLDSAGGALNDQQVRDLVEYVVAVSGRPAADQEAVARGKELFHGDAACNACHGDGGKGSLTGKVAGEAVDANIGAPNLTDAIWLFGGERDTLYATIAQGRTGHMPAWGAGFEGTGRKLDPLAIKQVTLYVHNLGGGQ
ncbi:MAG: cytochrome-c oxidase, cbb3-type subunit III [Magnetococcales bacterium]|nr:cytochrome-c oxidase, cbb3-type subunit III [Magnetococcales bacterium]